MKEEIVRRKIKEGVVEVCNRFEAGLADVDELSVRLRLRVGLVMLVICELRR